MHLVLGRLKQSGMFWTVRGANTIIGPPLLASSSGKFEITGRFERVRGLTFKVAHPKVNALFARGGRAVLYFLNLFPLDGLPCRGRTKIGKRTLRVAVPGRWVLSQNAVVLIVVSESTSEFRAREVRVVDEIGNQLGVMSLFDAMKQARDSGLDVVEISPNAVPPVCKLVD